MESSNGTEIPAPPQVNERVMAHSPPLDDSESPKKRVKLGNENEDGADNERTTPKGVAPIKEEYLIRSNGTQKSVQDTPGDGHDVRHDARDQSGDVEKKKKPKKEKGQNKNREFGSSKDKHPLCPSRMLQPEFSPLECKFGSKCKFEHDLRKYLSEGKREDLLTFDGKCPIWEVRGACSVGWKCRFVSSHSKERDTEDGRKELVLIEDEAKKKVSEGKVGANEGEIGVVNIVTAEQKYDLNRRRVKTPKSDAYLDWLNKQWDATHDEYGTMRPKGDEHKIVTEEDARQENRAAYVEPPFLPSEKRRIYYGPETPVLAPLTTQGNLPFRRLCVELGAQITWSEMAMGLPLIQGQRSEWALTKAHESELAPPTFTPSARGRSNNDVVAGYNNSQDFKFGVQIAAHKPWLAARSTEILTSYCPRIRAIDLNCGCPIDLLYRQGAGSALLDAPSKLEKIVKAMNQVSGEVPITVKIRMGTKDNQPTAEKLIERLVLGGPEEDAPAGAAALTLHGRSRQQRYTRTADWNYISDCAALIKRLKQSANDKLDTAAENDARGQANGSKMYFIGNGDCFSHTDYFDHIENANVDSVMVARGALIKPWIFEEIEKGQYLDKSASQRLEYIEKFVKFGLETWGSDEMGVGTTRRFLLEWLSFACRYVPIGLLAHLPPRIQDRPPSYRGRNEMETLLSSENYRDWIKISEMFLGPAHPDFRFEPKHKSNAYEAEG